MIFAVLNVAAGKAPMQSSVAEGGIPQKAVDGSTSTFFDLSTCSLTEVEKQPWWYVNLLEPYMVQLVRIDFGQGCCGEYMLSNYHHCQYSTVNLIERTKFTFFFSTLRDWIVFTINYFPTYSL